MIMAAARARSLIDAKLSGHAEVNAEPGVAGEAKKQVFSMDPGFREDRARQGTSQPTHVTPAEDAGFGVQR